MTVGQLQDLLPLSMTDVRGIWAAIEYTADSSLRDPLGRATKIYMEALRRASYGLLVRIVGHWVRGGRLNTERSISISSRLKDLQTTSNIEDPPAWPKAPPKGDRPSSVVEWVESSAVYAVFSKSPYYQRLIERITEISPPERPRGPAVGGRKTPETVNGDDESESTDGDEEESDDAEDAGNDDSVSESSLSEAPSLTALSDSPGASSGVPVRVGETPQGEIYYYCRYRVITI